MTNFIPDSNMGKLIIQYVGYYRNKGNKIRFILDLFKDKTLLQSELLATLYACWNNRLIQKQTINDALLIKDVHEWSAQKIKYEPEEITEMFSWMNEVGLKPTGFGKVISKVT